MMRRRQSGFTLLELIVVIGVFSVFAAMAYGGLDRVMQARARIEQSLTRTEEYQKAYQRLRSDFENASPRGIRDADGIPQPAFGYDRYNKRIELTRGGWANLLDLPRASLQRVSYFLDDSKSDNKLLMRRTWPVLDRAPQTAPIDTPLLTNVDELQWRFLDKQLVWQTVWPAEGVLVTPGDVNVAAPLAVEMTLRTRDWGEFKLLFKLGPDTLVASTGSPLAGGTTSGTTAGTTTGTLGGRTGGLTGGTSGGGIGGTTGDTGGGTDGDTTGDTSGGDEEPP